MIPRAINYLGKVENSICNGIKSFYNVIIGDSIRHKQWQKREEKVREMAIGKNLDDVVELNNFVKKVECELDISEVA